MAKFEINEIAVYVGPVENGATLADLNKEVTILTINHPLPKGEKFVKAFSDAKLDWPNEVIYGIQWPEARYSGYVPERKLRKRRPPNEQLQRFRDTLRPSDKQFRPQLERWLNPVPADLETRARRIHDPVEEINKRRDVFEHLYSTSTRLQPFDNFFEME